MSAGVVPIDLAAAGKGIKGCQSVLSVYPIAIANCAEKRYETVVWFQTCVDEQQCTTVGLVYIIALQ